MSKQIQAIDMAIEQLQKEKINISKRLQKEKQEKDDQQRQQITSSDKKLITKLHNLAKWWRTKGQPVEKILKITVKANLIWTEDRNAYVDGYDYYIDGEKVIEFDDFVRDILFDKQLQEANKKINQICDKADKLETKYKGIDLDIFT
jgi:hypothetical protein